MSEVRTLAGEREILSPAHPVRRARTAARRYYLLLWDASKSADEWYATAEDLRYAFEGRPVEWLSAEDSAAIPGRHRHGTQKVPAGWYADRPGRHEKRYWDRDLWTAEISDDGVTGLDPLDRDGR